MVQLRSVTRAFALADDGRQPGEVLTRLNRYQLALDEEELVTVIYAIINAAEGTLSWSSAGHPPPLLRTSVGETRFLDGGDALMGIEDTAYHTMQQVIGQRDTLTLYTDGLVERRGESLDTGLERLASAVASGPQEPRPLCEHVLGRLLEPDRELHDDVTAVIVRLS
jgi:serine phosphatase RsbU (regulator of sigma subunit)